MNAFNLSEAEIQLLASLWKARKDQEGTDRELLVKSGERYWIFKEDWTQAFATLLEKGLIQGDDSSYSLTAVGHTLARQYHSERPDKYW